MKNIERLINIYNHEGPLGESKLKILLLRPLKIVSIYFLILIPLIILASNIITLFQLANIEAGSDSRDLLIKQFETSLIFYTETILRLKNGFNREIFFFTLTALFTFYIITTSLPDKLMSSSSRFRYQQFVDIVSYFQIFFSLYLITANIYYSIKSRDNYEYLLLFSWILLILSNFQQFSLNTSRYKLRTQFDKSISARLRYVKLRNDSNTSRLGQNTSHDRENIIINKIINPLSGINNFYFGIDILTIIKLILIHAVISTLPASIVPFLLIPPETDAFHRSELIINVLKNSIVLFIINIIFLAVFYRFVVEVSLPSKYNFFNRINYYLIYFVLIVTQTAISAIPLVPIKPLLISLGMEHWNYISDFFFLFNIVFLALISHLAPKYILKGIFSECLHLLAYSKYCIEKYKLIRLILSFKERG